MAKPKKRQEDSPPVERSSEPAAPDYGNGNFMDRVAARAYELYLERGAGDGQAVDDWLAAERELSSPPGVTRK